MPAPPSLGWVQDETGAFFNGGAPYELTGTCTGFGVHPDGYVATAGHCVDTAGTEGIRASFIRTAAEQVVARIPGLRLEEVVAFGLAHWTVEGQATDSPIDAAFRVSGSTLAGPDGDGLPARVVDVRSFADGDVALLKVETTHLPTLELAPGSDVPVGTPVLTAGYPASVSELVGPDAEPSIKDGQVSGTQTIGSGQVLEISAALTPGMSGGPMVDLDGRVLGVNSFGPAGAGQAFNFVTPASGVAELLDRNGVQAGQGPTDHLYREALDAYYAGRYTDAISALDRLLEVVPAHSHAEQLRADAIADRERYGDPHPLGAVPVGYWVAVAAGVLAVAVLGLLLTVRHRRAAAHRGATPPHPGRPGGAWPGAAGGPWPAPAAGPGTDPMGPPPAAHPPFPAPARSYGPPPGPREPITFPPAPAGDPAAADTAPVHLPDGPARGAASGDTPDVPRQRSAADPPADGGGPAVPASRAGAATEPQEAS